MSLRGLAVRRRGARQRGADRALADVPGYSMATLLRQVISAGAPPSMARLPLTPEEVAACYEGVDGTEEGDTDDEFDENDYNDEDESELLLDGPCPICDVSPGDQSELG